MSGMKYIVGISGGIDSQTAYNWVADRYPKSDIICTNSNAGWNEHPLTEEWVEWFSTNVHPVVRCNPKIRDVSTSAAFAASRGLDPDADLTFGEMIRLKGRGPGRRMQFCTDILKLRPQQRWVESNLKGQEY